ncbi:unnamed protein product [Ectocarpus fasciculatus]
MPKSNFLRKKNKTGATADFKRLKAKVGKRAPQAASHTDTSFKSKRVKVSAQSILHDLGDEDAVTARGQGVQELLVQLRHYSPASKREALAGLKSIVDRHRSFAEVNFARLAEASLELAVCFDNDVRKGLLAFQETLLNCVSARTFSPFANLYMAYVVSAMTSLTKGVRRDSLTLLALMLARFPAAVADRAERLAPNYATLLAADPASKKHAGRAEALQSLVSLFRAVSRRYGSGGSGGKAGGGVDGGGGGGSGLGTARLSWKQGSRRNGALMLCPCSAHMLAGNADSRGGGTGGAGPNADSPQIKALASILPTVLERLREVWIEALAAVPPDIGLMQNVVHVLLEAIASPAWTAAGGGVANSVTTNDGGMGTNSAAVVPWHVATGHGTGERAGGGASAWFSRFVPLVLEAFPVRPLEGELLGNVEEERLRAIQGLNMGLCELVVAACAGPGAIAAADAAAPDASGAGGGEDPSEWLAPVLAHVHEVLRDEVGRSGVAGPQISSVLRVLSAATHNPAGKSSAFSDWTAQRQRLLSAFGDFLESLPAHCEAKLLCIRFVCRLATTLLRGAANDEAVGDDAETPPEVCRWLRSLPELLCRWGGEFPRDSDAVLGVLVEVAKHALPPQQPLAATGTNVGGNPNGKGKAKGKTTSTGGALAAGSGGRGGAWAVASSELLRSIEPALLVEFFGDQGFLLLPAAAQRNAVSFLYHLPSIPGKVVCELAAACSEPAALDKDVRSFVLEVMHHRRRSLSPSAYLGFLVSILTASAEVRNTGGAKRTAGQRAGGSTGGGKRRRQRSGVTGGGGGATHGEEPTTVAVVAPPTLWETVFGRDEVTGAVCNSLAMIGTRGGKLLEALQPTLLQLLRHRSIRQGGGGSAGKGEKKQGTAGGRGSSDVSVVRSLDEISLAAALQGQRAAMACVLCCWEGLDVATEFSRSPAPADTNNGSGNAKPAPSPLSALEKPMAAACVWAMKTAGTVEAAEKARGAHLLRPVLVLVKRWPALLPLMVALIVETTSEVVEAAKHDAADAAMQDRTVGIGGTQPLEPILRCLQTVVRDQGLQGQLRRRHIGVLREGARTLCAALDGSPLKGVVVQLQADVDVLGGGAVEDRLD